MSWIKVHAKLVCGGREEISSNPGLSIFKGKFSNFDKKWEKDGEGEKRPKKKLLAAEDVEILPPR